MNGQTEEWRVYPLDERYEVSNLGRVKRLEYITTYQTKSKNGVVSSIRKAFPELIYTPYKYTYKGFQNVEYWYIGGSFNCAIHILLARTWIPNPDNKPEVNHIDGNGLNNSLENLEWVTRRENQLHAYETGLRKSKKHGYE